ncbi:MAG: hypothetical protein HZA95_01095 [Candidatus Vogelbacteria bacterium]|nr:hypothetical protein [Candidatus Vogelbacteria bacterium]
MSEYCSFIIRVDYVSSSSEVRTEIMDEIRAGILGLGYYLTGGFGDDGQFETQEMPVCATSLVTDMEALAEVVRKAGASGEIESKSAHPDFFERLIVKKEENEWLKVR